MYVIVSSARLCHAFEACTSSSFAVVQSVRSFASLQVCRLTRWGGRGRREGFLFCLVITRMRPR